MSKVLIVYATRSGETEKIANIIAEGVRFTGNEAEVKNIKDISSENDTDGYDALVLGSPTYHGDMIQSMKTLLFLLEKSTLEGKPGGSFGSFGWSGEAPDRIFDTMQHIYKMDMVSNPLRLKATYLGGGIAMAQDYGKEITQKLSQ
jgi:flavorubredoxin